MADNEYDIYFDKSEFSEEHLKVLSAVEQAEQLGGGSRRRRSRSATPSTTPTRLRAKVTPTTKAGFVTTNALQRRANLIEAEDSPTPTSGVDEQLASTADVSLPPLHGQISGNADPYSFMHRAAMPYVYPPAPTYMPQQHSIYHQNEHRTPEPIEQSNIGAGALLRVAHESSRSPEPTRGHVVDALLHAPPSGVVYRPGDAARGSSRTPEPARGLSDLEMQALLRGPPSRSSNASSPVGVGYGPGDAARGSSRTPGPARGHLSELEMQALLRGPPSRSSNASSPVNASHEPSRTPEPIGGHDGDGRMQATLRGLPKSHNVNGSDNASHTQTQDVLGGDVGIQGMLRGPLPRPGITFGPGDGSFMPSRTPGPVRHEGHISDIEMQALLRGPPLGSHNASRESMHALEQRGSGPSKPSQDSDPPTISPVHLQPPIMNVIPPTPDRACTTDSDQRHVGRRSDSVNEIVREGFQRLDKEFASLAEAAGYTTAQDLINKYFASHRSTTSWNMYQEYFKAHEATEMERLKDVEDVPQWEGTYLFICRFHFLSQLVQGTQSPMQCVAYAMKNSSRPIPKRSSKFWKRIVNSSP
jgi:hypothetical protein